MKIALDPTPFHHSHSLLEFPRVVADLGYKYMQMTPHADFIPFYNHPKADDELVGKLKKACKDAGIEIASVLPVLRWSGPDEDAREAAVRYWKRAIQITVDLGVSTMNTEFSGRPGEGRGIRAGLLPLHGGTAAHHRARRHRPADRSAPGRLRRGGPGRDPRDPRR